MRWDGVRHPAAYPEAWWMLRAGARRRIERPDTLEETYLASRHTRQVLAGVAVLRGSAYPAAEF
jgi:hypothetical protein